jgi:hypothetical protein
VEHLYIHDRVACLILTQLVLQIGSIDVLDDADPASASYNSTAGSGGGFLGAGYGGGRIVLKVSVTYSARSAFGLAGRAMCVVKVLAAV